MARKKKKKSSGLNIRTRTEKHILRIFFVIYCLYAITLFAPVIFTMYNSLKTMREYNTNTFNFPGFFGKCPACTGEAKEKVCADFAGYCWAEIKVIFATFKAQSGGFSAFFKTIGETFKNIFANMHFENYVNIFDKEQMTVSIPFAIFNTLWRTIGSCLTGLFFTAATSYVVCKYQPKFPWLRHVHTFVITIMIVPILGSTAAAYEINHNILQIANKPWLWWITWTSGIGFGFLMLYSAWQSLSWSYAEAAFIDGASNFRVFFNVMMPMIKPVMIALFVVNFIGGWGEYMETIMYMDEWPSLGYMVYQLQSRAQYFGMPMYFAVIVVSMVPTIGVFIGFQETIMQNMTTGGLKG